MNILRGLFGGTPRHAPQRDQESSGVLWIYVECVRCRERLRVRVNKLTDLSLAADASDEEDADAIAAPSSGYVLRKELLGNNCPRLIEVRASFDARRTLIEMTAHGGRLLTAEEYAAPQA